MMTNKWNWIWMVRKMNRFTALVLDCESHFKSEHNKLIYHIAWVMGNVCDPSTPRVSREYYVREFLPLNYWKHSYVDKNSGFRKFWKLDSRKNDVDIRAFSNPMIIKSWAEIMKDLAFDISISQGFGSYNWTFDSSAIDITNRFLTHSGIVNTFDIPKFCLLDCYANKIINQTYFSFIDGLNDDDVKNYFSKSGKNLGYSAEVMARYMMEHHHYVEAHTALEDATVEFELLEYFVSKHYRSFIDDFLGKPKSVAWKSIRERHSSAQKMRKRNA